MLKGHFGHHFLCLENSEVEKAQKYDLNLSNPNECRTNFRYFSLYDAEIPQIGIKIVDLQTLLSTYTKVVQNIHLCRNNSDTFFAHILR